MMMKPIHLAIYGVLGLLISTAGPSALAWVPALDEATAKTIVDVAYRRVARVETSAVLSLNVQNAGFLDPKAVSVYNSPSTCLSQWLTQPTNYASFGSRPSEIIVTGQGDEVLGVAQTARDEFKNITAAAALDAAKKRLPDGHLKVFMGIVGLKEQLLRDAYDVRVLDGGKLLQPYRAAFLNDWAIASDGRFSGTMVYYFNLSKASINPNGLLPLLVRTEADSDCAFQLNIDLAVFR
jgi:hypothetical protein